MWFNFSRSRVGLLLFAGGLVALLSLRHHIVVLYDIVNTYSGFYPLLSANPDLLFRFPQPVEPTTSSSTTPTTSTTTTMKNSMDHRQQVPRIIHNIALGGSPNSARFQDATKSCRVLHPDWTFRLWTDAEADVFLRLHYPDIHPHYARYPQHIQRANVLRYAVLHHHGGVYMDLDIACRVPLDSTRLLRLPFASPGAHPAGVNNALLVARPGHAFLARLLAAVPARDLHWGLVPFLPSFNYRLPYVENMLSTGCMFFSSVWMRYAADLVAGRESDPVYVLANEAGNLAPHMLRGAVETPLVAHGGASSWHGWDAAVIIAVGRNYHLVMLVALAIAMAALLLMVRCLSRRRQRGRSSQDRGILTKVA